jgi:lysophospholipase L1-like esterase
MIGGLLRLAAGVAVVLAVLAGALELGLRAAGAGPSPRTTAGLSQIIPDGWTGFRLRPGVAGQEAFTTNDLGMHAPRTYTLAPPPVSLRVAVLGSSVVYGLGLPFADAIPGAVERELQLAGQRAEVLNFGTHRFTIVNVSAQLQAYVHQFQPDVVVVVVDLQVALVDWPDVRPSAEAGEGIEKLGWWEALLKRASRRSALVALFDDPRRARRWIRGATGLRLRPRPALRFHREAKAPPPPPVPVPTPTPDGRSPSSPPDRRAYEERRERELAAPMAAMAAFCAEKSIALYFVTPYGPYFDLTEDELDVMAVHHFLEDATRVHGDERDAIAAEVELITRVVRRVAGQGSAHVIDMLDASRRSSLRTSPHFAGDGVHLSPRGNAAVGKLIAERIVRDIERRRVGAD